MELEWLVIPGIWDNLFKKCPFCLFFIKPDAFLAAAAFFILINLFWL